MSRRPGTPQLSGATAGEKALFRMTSTPPAPLSLWTRRGWLWAGLLAVLAFLPSLHYPFLGDDIPQVEKNDRLTPPIDWSRAVGTPHWPYLFPGQPLWRPGLQVSLAVNRLLTGPGSTGFHIVNILLHGLVACVLWRFVRSLGGREPTATLAAVLFALHPVHTEAVVSIVGRAELQMTLFTLLACAAGFEAIRRRGLPLLLMAGAAYAVAFFNKEQGFLTPVFLFVGGIAIRFLSTESISPNDAATNRGWKSILHRHANLAWMLLFFGAIGIVGLSLRFRLFGWDHSFHTGNVGALVNPLVAVESPWIRMVTGLRMFGRGVALFLFPLRLSSDYSSPSVIPGVDPMWITALSAATLLVLIAAPVRLLVSGRRCRENGVGAGSGNGVRAALGIVFFLIFYLPVTNMLTLNGTIFGERMLYLPSVGLCLSLAVGIEWAWRRCATGNRSAALARYRPWLIAAAVLVLLSWCWRSQAPWRSARTLGEQAVRVVPNSAHAHYALATSLYDEGDWEEAIRESRTAIRLWPSHAMAWHLLGIASIEVDDLREAESALRKAIELDPGLKASYNSLGNVLAMTGRHAEALRYFHLYQKLGADDPEALRRKIEFTRKQIGASP